MKKIVIFLLLAGGGLEPAKSAIPTVSPSTVQPVTVLTGQYDNARTGANLNETVLNTSNVLHSFFSQSQFGKLFTRAVDGDLYAQPLYVPNINIPGEGVRNVVYVATMHNTVYAFDADNASQSTPLWQVKLGPSADYDS